MLSLEPPVHTLHHQSFLIYLVVGWKYDQNSRHKLALVNFVCPLIDRYSSDLACEKLVLMMPKPGGPSLFGLVDEEPW